MKNLVTLLGAAALISGCAAGPTTGVCEDPPITRINIVFAKNNEIRVSPGVAKTDVGKVLRFKFTGDSGTKVTVSEKDTDPKDAWINGSGMGGEVIYFCASEKLFDGVDPKVSEIKFDYDINVAGVGTLDPRVTVRR